MRNWEGEEERGGTKIVVIQNKCSQMSDNAIKQRLG